MLLAFLERPANPTAARSSGKVTPAGTAGADPGRGYRGSLNPCSPSRPTLCLPRLGDPQTAGGPGPGRTPAQTQVRGLLVGLLLLHLQPILLVDQQLAGCVSPRQLLAGGLRLGLGSVHAGGPVRPFGLHLPTSVGVGRDDVGLQLALPPG